MAREDGELSLTSKILVTFWTLNHEFIYIPTKTLHFVLVLMSDWRVVYKTGGGGGKGVMVFATGLLFYSRNKINC